MTDTNTAQNMNQKNQTPKKNFFGGEINPKNAEYAELHSEITPGEDVAQLTQLQESVQEANFDDFDPFATDEYEEVEEKESETGESRSSTGPRIAAGEEEMHPHHDTQKEGRDAPLARPIDEEWEEGRDASIMRPNEDDSENEEIPHHETEEESIDESTIRPTDETKEKNVEHRQTQVPENDDTNDDIPSQTTEEEEIEFEPEEEIEQTPEEYEQEPEFQTTGNEVIDKFLEVTHLAKKIFELSTDKSHFKILGGKNPQSTLEYFIYLIEDEEHRRDLFIKKVETNHQGEEEAEHLLQWSYHSQQHKLDIFVDEIILYELGTEIEDSKRKLIGEKLNKFWFLFETYYQDLYKTHQEQQEAQEKKKQLHEIFRSF